MKFMKFLLFAVLAIALLASCSDSSTDPDDDEINLKINEFMASNDFGHVDENGEHGDWIEIYNAGDDDVDLAGMYISDDADTLTVWQIPASKSSETTVEAGEHLVLWADKDPDAGELHVNIKLSSGGEDIVLTDADGTTVLDQLTYDAQTTDVSYGRTTDGGDSWGYYGFGYDSMPTPGTTNGSGEAGFFEFKINEFMASNDYSFADENGEFDDWIEIYNAGNIPGDIAGLWITDDMEELNTWQIPDTDADATTIMPGDYLILWADKEPEQGILHIDIKLSGSGEAIALTETDEVTIIDSYVYAAQTTDVSEGRVTDGAATWGFFGEGQATIFTPGDANGSGAVPEAIFMINEFLASNTMILMDPDAEEGVEEYDDWIEIYNAGNIPADLGGMFITDDLTDLIQWQIPLTEDGTTKIMPGGYLILWADKQTEQGPLHVDIKLSADDGEDIVLVMEDGTTVVDSYTFGTQTADVSEGRLPDGGDVWEFFTTPTPGTINE